MQYPEGKEYSEEQKQKMQLDVDQLGSGLAERAGSRIKDRQPIEDRWLEDIRQNAGKYPEAVLSELKGSKVFVNITRPKTNGAEAKLSDMLFPTDDRNWAIRPTPVPDMEGGDEVIETDEEGQEVTRQSAVVADAKKRCEAMQEEMDDQLTEAKYNEVGREVIHFGCLLGTGILKGPVIIGKDRKSWEKITNETGETAHVVKFVRESQPTPESVDPFNFFPDLTVAKVEDGDGTFERHYFSKRQMTDLLKRPDFIEEQIRRVLKEDPDESPPNYLTELRTISGITGSYEEKKYLVWEYHGPIKKSELIACGCEVNEDDPLEAYDGVVWISNEIAIKAIVNPMDTQEINYSLFCFEKDESCPFGYGVPYLMRNPQAVINSTWRMIMDHAGLTIGGQVVVNDAIIEPVPNAKGEVSWDLENLKVWRLKDETRSVAEAFKVFEIRNNLPALKDIFLTAQQLGDIETGLPMIGQGEQAPKGASGYDTKGGMEMLLNNSNIVIRRSVKNYDKLTKQFIGRLYDWNMQFNPREDIKGDYKVDARGSGALLLKETQRTNAMALANVSQAPGFAPYAKLKEAYKIVVGALQYEPDEVCKTDQELKDEAEANKGNADQDPERQKLLMQYAMHREKMEDMASEREAKAIERDAEREVLAMQLALKYNMTMEGFKQKLKEIAYKTQGERQKISDQATVEVNPNINI